MIKIDVLKKQNGLVTLVVTSNDPLKDKDKLDLIGAAILSTGEKRGGFKSEAQLEISVLDSTIA